MMPEGRANSKACAISIHEEAALLHDAWIKSTGRVPADVEIMIQEARFLDAAIELGLRVLGQPPLVGWLMKFTSAGGPYEVSLFSHLEENPICVGKSEVALSSAFLDALGKWG